MWGMPKRTIPRRPPFDLDKAVEEYLSHRSLRERSEFHEGDIKRGLMDYLEAEGEVQQGGHRTATLDQPQTYYQYKAGRPVQRTVTGIERKRRSSSALNEDRTMAMLKALDLLDSCTEVVLVINEDAILAANYEGKITDEQLKGLYDDSETFAFYLTTEEK